MDDVETKNRAIDKADGKRRIESEEDFVFAIKYGYSLKQMMRENPNGLTDQQISRALLIPLEEVEEIFSSAIKKIRQGLVA